MENCEECGLPKKVCAARTRLVTSLKPTGARMMLLFS
jgi:hypothetical protein